LAAAVRVACRAAAGTPLSRTGFTAKVGAILQAVKAAKGAWEEPGQVEPFEFSLPTLSNECEQTRQVASSIIPIILANSLEVIVGGVRRVRVASGCVGLPVHERLYAKSKAPSRQAGQMEVPQRVLEDIAECTFSPTLPTRDPKNLAALVPGRGEPGAVVEIKGAKEHLERVKAGRQREADEEDIFAFNETRYQKAMTAYRREPEKAFKWHTDVRFQEKARNSATKREPLLTIDVELSKTLTAKISVREGDHPAELAGAFCLLYGLNGESKEALTLMVSENMRLNNVANGGQDGEEAYGVEGSMTGTGGLAESTCAATLDSAGFPSDDDCSEGGMHDPHAQHSRGHPDNSDNDEDSETGGLNPNPMVQMLTLRALKEFEELEARSALSESPAATLEPRPEPGSHAKAAIRDITATPTLTRELLDGTSQYRSPSLSELVGSASPDASRPHEMTHESNRGRSGSSDSAANDVPFTGAGADGATGRTAPGPSVPRLAEVAAREAAATLDLKKLREHELGKTSGNGPKWAGGRKGSMMSTMADGSSGDSLVSSGDEDEIPLDEAIYYDDYNDSKVPHVRPSWAEGDGTSLMGGEIAGFTYTEPMEEIVEEEEEEEEEEEDAESSNEGRFRGFSLDFPSPDSAAHEPQTNAHAEAGAGTEGESARPTSAVHLAGLGLFAPMEEEEGDDEGSAF